MSLLVSIATSRGVPVVVGARGVGSVEAKTVSPLTAFSPGIAPATGAAGAVVRPHVRLAPMAVPGARVRVPATVAVKTVPAANGVVGVRVAIVPVASSVTVAGTFAAAPAARRLNVAVVIVAAFMAVLNVAVTLVLVATPVALGAGVWAVTVGGALTGAAGAVVKLQTTFAPSAVPAALVTVPATVAVKTVPAANGVVGVRVAMVPVASSVTVAGTFAAAPAARRLKLAVVMVAAFIRSEEHTSELQSPCNLV